MVRLLLVLYIVGGLCTIYLLGVIAYDVFGFFVGALWAILSGFFIGVVLLHTLKGEW